ncbi:aerolysin family beta-barrel pore-forming toxin [Vibrio chagasii]|nr:aerolysin family beta-barrel pore-forming toxin [Vibrio chagasii]
MKKAKHFADTNSGQRSKASDLQAILTVPARSKWYTFRVEFLRSSISCFYRIKANMSYDVNFTGFLRYSGNALVSHFGVSPYALSHIYHGHQQPKSKRISATNGTWC